MFTVLRVDLQLGDRTALQAKLKRVRKENRQRKKERGSLKRQSQ